MPKRTAEARIEFYRNKIRRIEERPEPRWRRIIVSSSSSDSSDNEDSAGSDTAPPLNNAVSQVEIHGEPPTEANLSNVVNSPSTAEVAAPAQEPIVELLELDPEILSALGSKTDDEPQYGENIHESLADLWLPLLKKGMTKEDKEKLLKGYLIPKNCTLLQAPILNPEIAAAVTESARNRDKKMVGEQQQLGIGITAVNRAMDILVNPSGDKVAAIRHLSDACRILSDSHYGETQTRVKILTPSLDKAFLNIVQDACRDDTLFGNNLQEKIKASKAIEKQGLQIKKSFQNPRPSTSVARAPQRGNWTAPPRYPPSKARGGARPPRRRPPPPPPPSAHPRPPPRPPARAPPAPQ